MESETSSTTVKIAGKIGLAIAAFIVGSILLVFMLMFGFFLMVKISSLGTREQFRIGGFQLGSYDPAMYPSEIVRRP
jgi:hypothetical protein